MSQLTTIVTRIENDPPEWVATTPHVPELRATHLREHHAINALMEAIRKHRARFEAAGKPVPWIDAPTIKRGHDVIVRRISGLWPMATEPPESPESPETSANATTSSPRRRKRATVK